MPTRPVTWDLDIPPASLLEPAKKAPPAGDVPSLDKLRTSLMGTRFELLKISTFAAFLLGFVGVAIHGSHLANPDDQFAANTGAAISSLAKAVSNQTAMLRGRTEAIALAATRKARAVMGHASGSSAPVMMAKADLHAKHSLGHHKVNATASAPVQVASLESHHGHHKRHHQEPVVMAAAEMQADPQWSGNLLDLPDFVTAESSVAGHKLLNAMQGGIETSGSNLRNQGQNAAHSIGRHFDVTNPDALAFHSPTSILADLISPDSLMAGMAALLLYMIFVVVLVQIKGGIRSLGSSHAV